MNEYETCKCLDDLEYNILSRENKTQVCNELVKNYLILKELNFLNFLEEDDEIKENDKSHYDYNNIIAANKYILDFLHLKKKNISNLKEEKQLTNKYKKIKKKDINNIINMLNTNKSNLLEYKNNIINSDKLNSFLISNQKLKVENIEIPKIFYENNYENLGELLKNLITNYNFSLNIIKIQQNILDDFVFHLKSLLMNNHNLNEQNKSLLKNSIGYNKENIYDGKFEIKIPFIEKNNTYSLLQSQLNLYREHINQLYNQIDDLKKIVNIFNADNINI